MATHGTVTWASKPPEFCDMCGDRIESEFVDGRIHGRWGCFCITCVHLFGVRLGLGFGQQFTKQTDGTWIKTGG